MLKPKEDCMDPYIEHIQNCKKAHMELAMPDKEELKNPLRNFLTDQTKFTKTIWRNYFQYINYFIDSADISSYNKRR